MKKSVSAFLCTFAALSLASCGTSAADVQTETAQSTTAEAAAEISETEAETITSAETTTTTEETTTTATETEKVCTCESDFQHYCCEYLNGLDFLAGGVYYGDINGDDKPEAVVEINPLELTYVLYENENGMQILPLETMSSWGYVRYIANTKQILFCPAYGHTWGTWGYEEYYILGWNGSDYEMVSSIFRESGIYYEDEDGEHSEYGQAYIDGEEVDNDIFEVKLAEYEKLRDENDYFPIVYIYDKDYGLNPDPETYINYIKENFPCFDNWNIAPNAEGIIIGNS